MPKKIPDPVVSLLSLKGFEVKREIFQQEGHLGTLFRKWVLFFGASPIAQLVKDPPPMRETPVCVLVWEDPLEKGKAIHSGFPSMIKGFQSDEGALSTRRSSRNPVRKVGFILLVDWALS